MTKPQIKLDFLPALKVDIESLANDKEKQFLLHLLTQMERICYQVDGSPIKNKRCIALAQKAEKLEIKRALGRKDGEADSSINAEDCKEFPLSKEQWCFEGSTTQLIKAHYGHIPEVKLVFSKKVGNFFVRAIELYGGENDKILSAMTVVDMLNPSPSAWFDELLKSTSKPLGLWLFAASTESSDFIYSPPDYEEGSICRGRLFNFGKPYEELMIFEVLEGETFAKLFEGKIRDIE